VAGVSASTKRIIALALALLLALAVILVAATSGLGRPSVPAGDVAIVDGVDNGTVSQEQYDRAFQQTLARAGLDKAPAVGSSEYQDVNAQTMQGLLLGVWSEGELQERGIQITDSDIQDELDQVKQSFNSEKQFERVVRQSKFCTKEEIQANTPAIECEDVVNQGRLLALQRRLAEIFTAQPDVTDQDVKDFYEANIQAFQQPETRNVRVILNGDEATVEKAKQELEGLAPGDSGFGEAWKKAAKKYSDDEASKQRGGLIEGLAQGQQDPQLEEQAFAAPEGELVGPFKTDQGYYLIEVVGITPASTQSLADADAAIRQQLQQSLAQAQQTEAQNDFLAKWVRRTECVPAVEMEFCAGYVAPEPEQVPGQETPTPAPVNPTSPIEPGTAARTFDGTTQTGLPQGPRQPPVDTSDQAIPQDALQLGGGSGSSQTSP
jgi:foldase protein PrsA